MRSSMKRTLAGVASMAVVASVAPFMGIGVAAAATNNGTVALNPISGTSSTNFAFTSYGAGGGLTTPQCAGTRQAAATTGRRS
jgi:hypothetical protein